MPQKLTPAPGWPDVLAPLDGEPASDDSLETPYAALTARTEYLRNRLSDSGLPEGPGFFERDKNVVQTTPLLRDAEGAGTRLWTYVATGGANK